MTKKIIHINMHVIRRNIKRAEDGEALEPPITVKDYKTNQYGHRVDIVVDGVVVASVVHSPYHPLSCGARVWIETQYEVVVSDELIGDRRHIERNENEN